MIFNSKLGQIFYEKVGHGPHLSFLHGFCEHSGMWEDIVAELSSDYCCVLIDLPGFGKSSEAQLPSISSCAEMVKSLLDYEGIERCTMIGHSMGGYVALDYLSQFESSLDGLALVHSHAAADEEDKKTSRLKVCDFVDSNGSEPFLKQFYPQLVAPENVERLREPLWELVRNTKAESIIQASKAMMQRSDHIQTIANCSLPLLFLTGDSDAHFGKELIFSQASHVEVCAIEVLDGVGHSSPLEAPDECLRIIQSFLQFCQMR